MHYYEKNIVEIRNWYTSLLKDLLLNPIYKEFDSVYRQTLKDEIEINKNRSTKVPLVNIFRYSLNLIPTFNEDNITKIYNRIIQRTDSYLYFDNLVKSVIKSNIILLTFNSTEKECYLVKMKYHNKINIKTFIHTCFILIGESFCSNPYLFISQQSLNKSKIDTIITDGIDSAIKKTLPIKLILKEYLKNDYISLEERINIFKKSIDKKSENIENIKNIENENIKNIENVENIEMENVESKVDYINTSDININNYNENLIKKVDKVKTKEIVKDKNIEIDEKKIKEEVDKKVNKEISKEVDKEVDKEEIDKEIEEDKLEKNIEKENKEVEVKLIDDYINDDIIINNPNEFSKKNILEKLKMK